MRQALVVVVHRDGQYALGLVLADHVIVEDGLDVARAGYAFAGFNQLGLALLTDDIHAELHALVADEHGRSRDQLANLVLAFPAEGAIQGVLAVSAG